MHFGIRSLLFFLGTSIAMAGDCNFMEVQQIVVAMANPAFISSQAVVTSIEGTQFGVKLAAYYSAHSLPVPNPLSLQPSDVVNIEAAMKTLCTDTASVGFVKDVTNFVAYFNGLPDCTFMGQDYKSGARVFTNSVVVPWNAACPNPSSSASNSYIRGSLSKAEN